MPGTNQKPLSVAQIDADLFMADSAIQKSETISSKALAGFTDADDPMLNKSDEIIQRERN